MDEFTNSLSIDKKSKKTEKKKKVGKTKKRKCTVSQPRERKRFTGKEELDTKTWKMSDLTRWNPRNEQTSFKRERRSSTSSTIVTKSEMGDFGDQAPRVNAPQVKIGADGRLVIDESSLVVQSAQINHESVWETVEEGRMSSKITSMSFRSRIFRKPNIWTERETDLFYEVLQCTGQDFGLMHHYLPQRSRVELKAKYNREEKINWPRLLKAISHPVRLDADLEARIARYQFEMEEEIREKKAKCEYEKAEEKRVRAQMREQQALERLEERQKKLQAKELIRQARELEKDAIQAAKCRQIESEKKDRQEAREMAIEAKRIAQEARKIINESRRREKRERKKFENDNLEREAERIIRRLMKESQREERRLEKLAQKKKTAKESRTPVANDAVDPHASGPELGDTTSDSSTTASSSDEDALLTKVAKREKERMKEEKRNLEPRKSVIGKKPIYVDVTGMFGKRFFETLTKSG
uniref:Myb_DNA-bind_7 domain-containing protein n=2 Tax=Caenorhabditis japonica TaxID=281687 RepID=A0A8R1IDA5_CAEJA